MFHVYYDDDAGKTPEPYDTFVEGQTATHAYATADTYNVRVVALSGGKAVRNTKKPSEWASRLICL